MEDLGKHNKIKQKRKWFHPSHRGMMENQHAIHYKTGGGGILKRFLKWLVTWVYCVKLEGRGGAESLGKNTYFPDKRFIEGAPGGGRFGDVRRGESAWTGLNIWESCYAHLHLVLRQSVRTNVSGLRVGSHTWRILCAFPTPWAPAPVKVILKQKKSFYKPYESSASK